MTYPKTVPELIKIKDSSSIQAIGYKADDNYLFIAFHPTKKGGKGILYRYAKVPKGTWNRFKKAPSKGMFMWVHIRDKFPYAKWTGSGWKKETALKKASIAKKKRKAQLK